MSRLRVLRILPPLALGAGLAAWLIAGAEPPPREAQAERRAVVRTEILAETPVRPVVRGYGNVQPAQSWQAVSEVSGAVVFRDPDLETGNMIPAGRVVLKIDPERYETTVAQSEADLAALRAELAQLAIEAANTGRIHELEQKRLTLAQGDLTRTRELVSQGTAPQARLDEQERATLQVERVVQELSNTLALYPAREARLAAQIAKAEAGLARARRDLEMTEIATPFDLRVAEVSVERHQFVGAGQRLVSGDGIARVEIVAQLPIESFPRLLGAAVQGNEPGLDSLKKALDQIETRVTLVSDRSQHWQGRVLRVANALDPQTRSVPVVIAVDAPYADANPPVHLPLVPNMYVEVVLTGPETEPRVAVPSAAVHQGRMVYLRDSEGRLALREVEIAWQQEGRAIIASGVSAGEEVIIDDLVPAIPGMLVEPAVAAK